MASQPLTVHTPAATIRFTGGDDDSSSISSTSSTDSLQIIAHDEEHNASNNNQQNNSQTETQQHSEEEATSQSSGETMKMKSSIEKITENGSRASTLHSSSEETMQRSIQKMADNNSQERTSVLNNNASDITQSEQCDTDQPLKTKRESTSPKRFNPFDKEEYDPNQKLFPQADTAGGCTSSSSSDQDSDMVISEDHFGLPEGHVGLTSIEEMELAINNCKLMILEAEEHSTTRRNLVKKLVELRLKLSEAKEEPELPEEGVKLVLGHRFETKNNARTKHYCESCNSVIWGVLHEWYRCCECGFCCHAKCLNVTKRTCASVKVAENPSYIFSITPEKGLSQQNYRCAECKTPISFEESGEGEPRQCEYTGAYYCESCHWNDTMVIPALVLHNWDFEPRKVCRASKQFLKLMSGRAVIQVCDINPMLFSFVEELNDVKRLREEILIMKKYFLTCKTALETKLLLQLRDRQHFVEGSDLYSLQDLQDVMDDVLLPSLAKIHASFAQHIKTDCKRCQGQGYICELCDYEEVLFPFDNHALVCAQCSTVIHRHCYIQRNHRCPKCERIEKRSQDQP